MMTDMGSFILYNIYFPNGGKGEERIQFKLEFYKSFQNHCEKLIKEGRKIVFVGDVNTAHKQIDTHNPIVNKKRVFFNEKECFDWIS